MRTSFAWLRLKRYSALSLLPNGLSGGGNLLRPEAQTSSGAVSDLCRRSAYQGPKEPGQVLALSLAALLTAPGVVARIGGVSLGEVVAPVLFGFAILGSAFLLEPAREAEVIVAEAGIALVSAQRLVQCATAIRTADEAFHFEPPSTRVLVTAGGDGLGPGDHRYKFIKKIFRNRFSQWAFGALHPAIGIGMADYMSRKSRAAAGKTDENFLGEDKEWLIIFC